MDGSAKWEWGLFAALLAIAVFLRWPAVRFPFENDSGAIAYHARLITRGEPLYGSHHTGHHLPGAYYLYAAAFATLGDRVESVKLLLIGWVAVTSYLIWRLGTTVMGRRGGMLAAVFSLILVSSIPLSGTHARIEAFVSLPQTAAVLALVHALRVPRTRAFFWVGLFSGIAVQFKATYVAPILLGAATLLIRWFRHRSQDGALSGAYRGAAWATAGGIAALLPTVLYFHAHALLGSLGRVFELGWSYTRTAAAPEVVTGWDFLLYPLAVLAWSNPVLLGLAIFAVYGLVRTGVGARDGVAPWEIVMIVAWFGLGFVETGVTRTFLPHYYLVLVPSLSVLAAWAVVRVSSTAPAASGRRRAILSSVLVASAVSWSIGTHRQYLARFYLGHVLGGESYEEFTLSGLPDGWGETALAVQAMADHVRARTERHARIYCWSDHVQLYYVADRLAPTDNLWPLYVHADGSRDRVFEATYVIVGERAFGYEREPQWLTDGLAREYDLETVLHGQRFFRRRVETGS